MAFIAVYLPLVLQERSFTLLEIGLALSLGSFIGLCGQLLWGFVSDKYGTIRKVLIVLFAGTIILFAGLYVADAFVTTMLFAVLVRIVTTSILPLVDLWTVDYTEREGKNFGRFRQWGSVGYVAFTLIMGFMAAAAGLKAVYWLHWLLLLLCISITLTLQETGRPKAGAGHLRASLKVLRMPRIGLFFVAVLIFCIPARAFEGFFSLHVKELGGGEMVIAVLSVVAPLFEVPFYLWGMNWMNRIGVYRLLLISGMLYVPIWISYAWNTSVLYLGISQIALSGANVLFYLAAMIYMRTHFPENLRSTGQLLLFIFIGTLSGVVGNLWAGFMLSGGLHTLMFLLCAAAVGLSMLLLQFIRQSDR